MVNNNIDSKNLLIVDDTPDNIRLLSTMLAEQGYKVRKALNGEMALNSCQADPPDLVILDIKMPDLDGYTVCERLKLNPETAEIPVVFISALDDVIDKVKAFQVGGVDYISKPFQCEEVLARVRSQLTIRELTFKLEQKVEARTAALLGAFETLQETQIQLVQSEKMATLGQLIAGIAHEINNPLGFITNNLAFAQEGVQSLMEHLQLYQQEYPQPTEAIIDHSETIDLEYVLEDLPNILNSIKIGSDRIQQLSISLRKFSRKNNDKPVESDLHDGLESTLLILKHRLKNNGNRGAIEIRKEYQELPQILCYPEQLNQVFMNLLANSIDALDERCEKNGGRSSEESYTITIATEFISDRSLIQIRVTDNGLGIPEDIQSQIFDYQFTTKPAGKGTGLGLAIAHQIIQRHDGLLECHSIPQQKTTFTIYLPIKNQID
ncbi:MULTISPECIES: response regulator [unclassified Roseofilum]|uniref:hybrid sensor histidine kinase/response regulator n=1 Tax=unclassified Roseofilum TaxID=2620099 RepID=UPI000E840DA4|nr:MULTISPECIES: response regulator [unclassified Roseofilum]MBP0007076.1 hybrid sensor histidine kinase/response regulator [Roseofilum sp. Belize Diploria]MBP0031584.1 hybrid sensor histidine kinase/response regulator [Roseofilum sp. Belize BBD 4]HBR00056.1 hybrid sensor histidine kinase/response regulator [Cyanobacteria bacterium UBA11691]